MPNNEAISVFFFIFSILSTLKIVINFISALLQDPPEKLKFSNRELIFYALTISYLITYIIVQ